MKPISDQEENELVILHLRQLCEGKQKTHVHIGEGPAVRPDLFLGLCLSVHSFTNVVKGAHKAWERTLSFGLSSLLG